MASVWPMLLVMVSNSNEDKALEDDADCLRPAQHVNWIRYSQLQVSDTITLCQIPDSIGYMRERKGMLKNVFLSEVLY